MSADTRISKIEGRSTTMAEHQSRIERHHDRRAFSAPASELGTGPLERRAGAGEPIPVAGKLVASGESPQDSLLGPRR